MVRFKKIIVLPSVPRGSRGGLKLGSKSTGTLSTAGPRKPNEQRS